MVLKLTHREWIVLILILGVDRISKLVAHATRPEGTFFRYLENTGAGFGTFQGHNALLALLAFAVLVLIVGALRTTEGHDRLALLVFGVGVFGNLWDRVQYGFVIDFIDAFGFFNFPVFNIADAAITLGALYLLGKAVRETYADWQFGRKARRTNGKKTKR
jgi:signal peptidase II